MSHGVVDEPLAGHRRVCSRSPDVLRDTVADLAVGHDVLVRGGLLDGLVNGAAVGSVNLVYVRYGGSVLVEAPATGSRVAVTVPLGPMEVRSSRERQTFSREGFVLAADRATVMRPDPQAGAIVIAVDRSRLDHALARLAGARSAGSSSVRAGPSRLPHARSSTPRGATWVPSSPRCRRLPRWRAVPSRQRCSMRSCSACRTPTRRCSPRRLRYLTGPMPTGRAPGSRSTYREPVSVADVAAGVGLSVRQLQEVVRVRFGLTPMQLLREIRLERARELLSSGVAPTVAAAAMDVGCAHLGRFAAAYRQRFGELPSETR